MERAKVSAVMTEPVWNHAIKLVVSRPMICQVTAFVMVLRLESMVCDRVRLVLLGCALSNGFGICAEFCVFATKTSIC